MRDRIGAGRQRGTGMRLNDDGIRIYEPISAVQDIAGAVHWRPPYGGHEAGDDAIADETIERPRLLQAPELGIAE